MRLKFEFSWLPIMLPFHRPLAKRDEGEEEEGEEDKQDLEVRPCYFPMREVRRV